MSSLRLALKQSLQESAAPAAAVAPDDFSSENEYESEAEVDHATSTGTGTGPTSSSNHKKHTHHELHRNSAANTIQSKWKDSREKSSHHHHDHPHRVHSPKPDSSSTATSSTHTINNGNSSSGAHEPQQQQQQPHSSSSSTSSHPQQPQQQQREQPQQQREQPQQTRAKSKTVLPPSPRVISYLQELPQKRCRRHIAPGLRVKVRFATQIRSKETGKIVSRKKWFGGRVSAVSKEGSKIRIKYDDGTSEVTRFPDKDVVIDDTGNGTHSAPAEKFIPPPDYGKHHDHVQHHHEHHEQEEEEKDGRDNDEGKSATTHNKTKGGVDLNANVPAAATSNAEAMSTDKPDADALGSMPHQSESTALQNDLVSPPPKPKRKRGRPPKNPSAGSATPATVSPKRTTPTISPKRGKTAKLDLNSPVLQLPILSEQQQQRQRQHPSATVAADSTNQPVATAGVATSSPLIDDATAPRARTAPTAVAPDSSNILVDTPEHSSEEPCRSSELTQQQQQHMESQKQTAGLVSIVPPSSLSEKSKSPLKPVLSNGSSFTIRITKNDLAALNNHHRHQQNSSSASEEGEVAEEENNLEETSAAALRSGSAAPTLPLLEASSSSRATTEGDRPRESQTTAAAAPASSSSSVLETKRKMYDTTVASEQTTRETSIDSNAAAPILEKASRTKETKPPADSSTTNVPMLAVDKPEESGVTAATAAAALPIVDPKHHSAIISRQKLPMQQSRDKMVAPSSAGGSAAAKRLHIHIPKAKREELSADIPFPSNVKPEGVGNQLVDQQQQQNNNHQLENVAVACRSPRPGKKQKRKHKQQLDDVSAGTGASGPSVKRKRIAVDDEGAATVVNAKSPSLRKRVIDESTAPMALAAPSLNDSDDDIIGAGKLTPRPRSHKESGARSGRRPAKQGHERLAARQQQEPGDTAIPTSAGAVTAMMMPKKKRRKQQEEDSSTSTSHVALNSALDSNSGTIVTTEQQDDSQWVQCDKCGKWRIIPTVVVSSLPQQWYCADNVWDPKRASCDAPEQTAKQAAKEKKRRKRMELRLAAAAAAEEEAEASLTSKEPQPVFDTAASSSLAPVKQKRASPVGDLLSDQGSDSHSKPELLQQQGAVLPRSEKKTAKKEESVAAAAAAATATADAEAAVAAVVDKKRGRGRPRRTPATTVVQVQQPNKDVATGTTSAATTGTVVKSNSNASVSHSSQVDETDNLEWVQCEKCEKWRKLPPHISADELPDVWYCSLNTWNPDSASCDAPEDKADGLQDVGFHSGSGVGKLSYRNLIFGSTGRKANRPVSERTRAAESLFLCPNDDEDAPPTVMYANSCAFVARGKNNAPDENEGMSVLELMNHSKLWAELRNAQNQQPLAYHNNNTSNNNLHNINTINFGEQKLMCYTFNTLPDDVRDSTRELILSAIGDKTLSSVEILQKAREMPSNVRLYFSINVVVTCLYEMVKEGLVECVVPKIIGDFTNGPPDWNNSFGTIRHNFTDNCTWDGDPRYRRAKPRDKASHKSSRCIKISKPWKRSY